jgi:hypothetical protein
VPDEHDALDAELVDHRQHVFAEGRHSPLVARLAGLAVSGEVDRHDLALPGEVVDLSAPVAPVARPAMDEDESWFSPAAGLEVDGNAVGGVGDAPHLARPASP